MFHAQTSVYGSWHTPPPPRLQSIDSKLLSWRVREGGGGGSGGDGSGGWGWKRLQQIYKLPTLPRKACFLEMDKHTQCSRKQTHEQSQLPKYSAHIL